MADQLGTVALLTKAADLAEKAAELPAGYADWDHVRRQLARDGWAPEFHRLFAASGPDHWRAVAAMLHAQLELHQPVIVQGGRHCKADDWEWDFDGCPTLMALVPLAELVVQQLGDTE